MTYLHNIHIILSTKFRKMDLPIMAHKLRTEKIPTTKLLSANEQRAPTSSECSLMKKIGKSRMHTWVPNVIEV